MKSKALGFQAALFLAGGTLFLVPAPVLYQNLLIFPLLASTFIGLSLHGVGWFFLWRTCKPFPVKRLLFGLSIGAFLVGIVVLPWISPLWFFRFGRTWVGPGLTILPTGLFAYIPTVFAPVALIHAVLFAMESREVTGLANYWVNLVGVGYLVLTASVSIVIQASFYAASYLPTWFFALAALTSGGYVLVLVSRRGGEDSCAHS
jgi:hypothetical protein